MISSDAETVEVSPSSQYGQDILNMCMPGAVPFSESSWSSSSDKERVKYVQPPNSEWKYGEGIETTERGKKWMEGDTPDNWLHIDPQHTSRETITLNYRHLMHGVMPRPIGFISSISEDGKESLAPYSSISAMTPPAFVSFAVTRATNYKHTAANVIATKDFTVNIISLPFVEQANATTIVAPDHISKWELSGLTKEKSTYVRAPRVKESAFSLECTYLDKMDIMNPDLGKIGTTVIFGLIKCIHVRKDVLNQQGFPDPGKLMAVTRMGDISYGLATEAFRLPIPDWSKDGEVIEKALAGKKQNGAAS